MIKTAFDRKLPRILRSFQFGSWALERSDRGGQDKARKVRAVGRAEESRNFNHAPNITRYRTHLAIFSNAFSPFSFRHPVSPT